ncbi:MAG: hypothetical protein C0423_19410 [Methylibium sp.]|nr:hypothetical protein [Methylibium sp.]
MSMNLLLERLDGAIDELRAAYPGDGPGFNLALLAQGDVLRQVHHGLADLTWSQPLDGDARHYMASESKPWVAALVMQEVAEGRLALDTDLRPVLPALSEYEQPLCAGHLLRHTSGIPDYLFLWGTQLGRHEHDFIAREQALALIAQAGESSFQPGLRYEYSNSNYLLLAELLQQQSGLTLAELAQRRFFAPWGMGSSSFEADPWRVLQRRARSYGRVAAEPAEAQGWQELPVPLGTWGDGGLWSTLNDQLRAERYWHEDWQHQGERSLWARCAAADEHYGPADGPYRFGLEWLQVGDQRLLFHGGGYGGFTCLLLRNPAQGVSLVMLSNCDGFDNDAERWAQRLWGAAQA